MNRPPINTRQLLEKLGVKPSRKLGQNFLVDSNITAKSVDLAGLESKEAVVEIGPGLGILTEALILAGQTVYAVEIDKRLADGLRERYADESSFHLMEGDAVKHPLAGLPDKETNFSVIANLPYAISTPWLDAVLTTKRFPRRMVLMLQKEAAQRFTAEHASKDFSAISIFLTAAYRPVGEHPVSRKCFYPWPEVDSILLQLDLKPDPFTFSDTCKKIIRDIFTQRRKQIGGICRNHEQSALLAKWIKDTEHSKDVAKCRPEELPLDNWIALDGIVKTAI